MVGKKECSIHLPEGNINSRSKEKPTVQPITMHLQVWYCMMLADADFSLSNVTKGIIGETQS